MKLINKTIGYYFLICIPLLLLASINSYYFIKGEIEEVSDEILGQDIMHAQSIIQTMDSPKNMKLGFDGLSSIVLTTPHKDAFINSDTSIYNSYEEEFEVYRMAKHFYNNRGQTYLITVLKPTMEHEELMEGLFSSFLVILMFLIIAFLIVNWLLSKTLWKPFYKTLHQLSDYDIKNHSMARFEHSSTKEFEQLNDALTLMTNKIYADYIQQKEFTENASHEMQTPLAVIKANIGLLMQSSNLKEEEMNQIQAIDNTVKKLSSLNKALLLLSKIENKQFTEEALVSIAETTKKVMANYQHLLDSKHISVEMNIETDIKIRCNPILTDILITNLVQNAIRHNQENGSVRIEIRLNSLTITNTGEPLKVATEDLFCRFRKNDASKESLGLGLSIVKSICESYGYNIHYTFTNHRHVFSLNFQ
ncbi:MAG: HAMP domain-containing histidine kinase [Bacteroidetes bacterium]|nr:HAMP domain-containing histidine kinase [Bacteroidota bacterium]